MGLQSPWPHGAVPARPAAVGAGRDLEAAERGILLQDWERMDNEGHSERPGEREA